MSKGEVSERLKAKATVSRLKEVGKKRRKKWWKNPVTYINKKQ